MFDELMELLVFLDDTVDTHRTGVTAPGAMHSRRWGASVAHFPCDVRGCGAVTADSPRLLLDGGDCRR